MIIEETAASRSTRPSTVALPIAADIEGAPEWAGLATRTSRCCPSDADGRAELVERESDAKVKTVNTTKLRFSYHRADAGSSGCRRRAT